MVVSLGYTLKLANGEVVDFSEEDEPLEYLHGASNIVPGLEKALNGRQVGEEMDVEVSPDEGYGDYDPEDVETVAKKDLPTDFPLELGMVLAVTDEDGNISEAYVREIAPNSVTLDFNHPLAGQALHFSVKVLGVRPATDEELAHGHPALPDGTFEDEDEFDDFDEYDDFDDEDGFDDLLDDEDDLEDEEDLEN
jgi:FKBP-type peptidyl-prolyl cis-trans isomerase SlyD